MVFYTASGPGKIPIQDVLRTADHPRSQCRRVCGAHTWYRSAADTCWFCRRPLPLPWVLSRVPGTPFLCGWIHAWAVSIKRMGQRTLAYYVFASSRTRSRLDARLDVTTIPRDTAITHTRPWHCTLVAF